MLTGKRLTQSLARTWTHRAAQWDLGQTLPVPGFLFLVPPPGEHFSVQLALEFQVPSPGSKTFQ